MGKNSLTVEQKKIGLTPAVVEAGNELAEVVGGKGMSILTPIFREASKAIAVEKFLSVPEVWTQVQALAGKPNGFVMDDKSLEISKKDASLIIGAVAQALTLGVNLTGNEFNIIQGKMMIVRAGWERLCREFEKDDCVVTDMDIIINGFSEEKAGLRKVPCAIKFALVNKDTGAVVKDDIFERDILISTKSGESADTTVGKAERRICKAFHRFLTGTSLTTGDENMGDPAPVQAEPSAEDFKGAGVDFVDAEVIEKPVEEPVVENQKTKSSKSKPAPKKETPVETPVETPLADEEEEF